MSALVLRYEDMRIDRLLIKEYQKQLELDLKRIRGLNDIEILLKEFEGMFAAYIGTKYALAVNSGTDALQLSLLALGIQKGDSVIVPDVTYPAVPLSVLYAGAQPIITEVKSKDLQIDESKIEKKIRKNTKAIIAVHMFARGCNIEAILEIAKKHNLLVIEDCCQAESSECAGRKLGSFGHAACFSFSYYKPLSSCGGSGGMVCFNDAYYRKILDYTKIWDDCEVLLNAGKRFSRMNLLDLIAVKVKFQYLKEIIKSRLRIKRIYEEGLEDIDSIRIFKDDQNSLSVPQNFLIYSAKRDGLGAYLEKSGVIWQRPYQPLHSMKIFAAFAKGDFFNSREYRDKAIQLPLYSFMKEEEASMIVDLFYKFVA